MTNASAFLVGAIVGAVGGAFVAIYKISKTVNEEHEHELDDQRAYYKEQINELKDEIAILRGEKVATDEDEPAKDLSKASYADYIKEHEDDDEIKVAYHNINRERDLTYEVAERTDDVVTDEIQLITKDQYEYNNDYDKHELYLFETEHGDVKILVDEMERFYDFDKFRKAYNLINKEFKTDIGNKVANSVGVEFVNDLV